VAYTIEESNTDFLRLLANFCIETRVETQFYPDFQGQT